jgi:hypothetical protein
VLPEVQRAAYLVKNNSAPVGVEYTPGYINLSPNYRVVTQNEFYTAQQSGSLVWVA